MREQGETATREIAGTEMAAIEVAIKRRNANAEMIERARKKIRCFQLEVKMG